LDGLTILDPNAIANPCGLIAKYRFNDTFSLFETKTGYQIPIDETNIALPKDKQHKFNIPEDKMDSSWLDLMDEHVMVWFQMESFPDFTKLWGHTNMTLEAGKNYTLTVENKWINVTQFEGRKYLYLSEVNRFGGKDDTFGVVLLIMTAVIVLIMFIFIVLYFVKIRGQDIYSTQNLSWD
jgi:hypothetical protein